MRLSEAVLDAPSTGVCKIDVDKVVKCFGMSAIARWHDSYTLYNPRAHLKIKISKKDAVELIRRLDLVEMPTYPFAHGSGFHTRKELIKLFERAMRKRIDFTFTVVVPFRDRSDIDLDVLRVWRTQLATPELNDSDEQ